MNERNNLCWKINWYRQSELEGSLLLGRVVRLIEDPQVIIGLTRHCVDEAEHAWLWTRTLLDLNLPALRIRRSYQSFYMDHGGTPSSVPEVLAFTHIFEHRVDQQFREELNDPQTPQPMRHTLARMIDDEQRHLDGIARLLETYPGSDELLERYRQVDRQVYERLLPYKDRIFDIPGLAETSRPTPPVPPTSPVLPAPQ